MFDLTGQTLGKYQLVERLGRGGVRIGAVPDVRGTSFFNFGLALYLTVLWRGRRKRDP